MNRTRKNYTLDPSTIAILERCDNASAYLTGLVQHRAQEWHAALETLRAAGWTTPDLHVACDALNGCWLQQPYLTPQAVALELHDAQGLNGTAEKHHVTPERWKAQVWQVSESWPIALALVAVVTEWWSGNGACEQAVSRVGSGGP